MIDQPSRAAHKENGNKNIRKINNNKTPIIIALVAILFIGLFTGYQLLAKKYSEEAVIKQFQSALISKDKDVLKELIVPADTRVKVNNQSLDALFSLIDNQPSLIQDIEDSLREEELGNNLFSIRMDGKHFGIFDRYVIDTLGYFITFNDPGVETTIYLNESEIGILDGSKETTEFGPFLAGNYTVKAAYKKDGKTNEDALTVTLTGTKATTEVALNIGSTEEKEEVKEKTVIKEVIREVPVSTGNSYYLLPHSSYSYLSYSDIAGFSKSELRLARNEIYARYGYIFQSDDLRAYFNSQDWYYPDSSYNGNLSSIEKHNVDFIKSYE
ncbi:YARHG domain-containing protein [Niallia sp. XMNu-256]|uniref:YARHG domain-containing protein n=1 Tax=Niallia sp. XMNu-256 TaxID=3082444 RepID=UPI0030CF4763